MFFFRNLTFSKLNGFLASKLLVKIKYIRIKVLISDLMLNVCFYSLMKLYDNFLVKKNRSSSSLKRKASDCVLNPMS